MSQTSPPAAASTPPDRYPRVRRILHWIGGPLLLAAFAAGYISEELDRDSAASLLALRLHVLLAVPGALLSVVRIHRCLKLPDPRPLDLPPWHRKLVSLDHRLLYLSSVLLGLTGAAMVLLGGADADLLGDAPLPDLAYSVPRSLHSALAYVFLGLFLAHLGGVVRYQLIKGETFRRMGLRR